MGRLYDLSRRIVTHLETSYASDALGLIRAKGQLATHTGILVSLIDPRDPDDPDKINKLEQALRELGVSA